MYIKIRDKANVAVMRIIFARLSLIAKVFKELIKPAIEHIPIIIDRIISPPVKCP